MSPPSSVNGHIFHLAGSQHLDIIPNKILSHGIGIFVTVYPSGFLGHYGKTVIAPENPKVSLLHFADSYKEKYQLLLRIP